MQKVRKVTILTKPSCDEDYTYTKNVIQFLLSRGIEVYIPQNIKYRISELRDSVHLCYHEHELLDVPDIILVLGGDGTMLDIAVRAAALPKPVLGINLGHLGFLTAIEKNEIEKLSALVDGTYQIERRMLLEVDVQSHFITHHQLALNDIVIKGGVPARMTELSLTVENGRKIGYRADGLVIATPTGSTAYSLSAGGPVLDPTLDAITVTPICPHTLLRAPLVFAPDARFTVCGKTRAEQTALCISTDGKNPVSVDEDSIIRIRRSVLAAQIVRIGEYRFYDIIESKLS